MDAADNMDVAASVTSLQRRWPLLGRPQAPATTGPRKLHPGLGPRISGWRCTAAAAGPAGGGSIDLDSWSASLRFESKFLLTDADSRGHWSAGRPAPTREGQVRWAVRGLITPGLAAGAQPVRLGVGAARGGAESLADALPSPQLTAYQGGRRCSWGRAGQGAGNEEAGGGPLAPASRVHCLARQAGTAGSLHCERRPWTARGRDSSTCASGRHRACAAGTCAGGGWHRGGRLGTARGLTASLGLRAGWEPVPLEGGLAGTRPGGRRTAIPSGNFKLAGGPLARGHSAGSGRGQLQRGGCLPQAGQAAWRPDCGRAGWRQPGADSGPGDSKEG